MSEHPPGDPEAIEVRTRPVKTRLVWVMLLRVGVISVLLGATLVLNYSSAESFNAPSPRFLLGLIAFTYLTTIVFASWFRGGWRIRLLARLQFGVDLLLWGCLAYVTGGIGSGFTFLFDLWVIVAAVALGGRAAFVLAGGAAVVLTGLASTMSLQLLPPLPDQFATVTSLSETLYFLGVNVASLFLVAALVSSLVTRIERTGRGLERERARRADLTVLHADIIRSLTVGLATVGRDGEILTLNPAGRAILELPADQGEGSDLTRHFPELAELIRRDASPGARGYGTGVTADGKRVPVDYSITPLLDAEGARSGSIVIFNDLTKVRRLEAALERTRKLAALGELAASLAHEIRNPLSAVSGSFQLLAARQDANAEDRSLTEIILREVERMERLVGDMLDYTRPREPALHQADVGRIADEVVQAFSVGSDAEGREVVVTTEGDLVAPVDSGQLRQVLWNLLRNAAQATGEGGRIEVRATGLTQGVVLEVLDTGLGIDAVSATQIFDPFFSTRERGLGLGLAICQRIAEAHGGRIAASDRSDGELGAVFRLELPRDGRQSS